MQFKLDENFGARTQDIFRTAGHDIHTVRDEGLQGATDQRIYEVCCSENLCLVTLDLDFADITRFPPEAANGLVVIRVPRALSLALLEQLIRQFLQALEQMSPEGNLWIVEAGRIRVHEPGS
jgi:predicted nuclease of predicted toxin-antitoxin system